MAWPIGTPRSAVTRATAGRDSRMPARLRRRASLLEPAPGRAPAPPPLRRRPAPAPAAVADPASVRLTERSPDPAWWPPAAGGPPPETMIVVTSYGNVLPRWFAGS